MRRYRRYPEYRDSGVDAIGAVPAGWRALQIKRVATIRTDRQNGVPAGQAYIGLEDIESETGCYAPTDTDSRQVEDSAVGVFQRGDVLYGKLRPYLRKSIVADADGVCSTEFLVLQPDRVTATWLHRWLLTPDMTQRIEAGCDGAKMPRASWGHVASLHITVPPPDQQAAIATAIDRETARIDALITKKTRFIELLQEKRQALITRAVTKGLDPNVKMKDSGVEWIGQVPEHWTVSRIKFVASIGNGSTPARNRSDYWENGRFPWLTSSCVNQESVDMADEYVTAVAMAECHLPVVQPPAILVGITGQGRTRGMATTLTVEATINQHIAYLKADEGRVRTQYLRRFVDAAYEWLRAESEGNGGTKGAITCEQLGSLPIVLPTIDGQDAILSELSRRSARIHRLITATNHSITLLKERRAAFITAAVTGQIDLRDPAPATQEPAHADAATID